MKKIVFALMAIAICCAASAQNFLTIKGGVNFTHPIAKSPLDYKTGVGAQLGASYSIGLVKNFYFEPGINIAYHSWKLKEFVADDKVGDMVAEHFDHKFNEWEIALPLHFDYRLPLNPVGLHVFTGPQISCGLSNKLKTKLMIGGSDMGTSTNMYGDDGMYKRFGVAWNIGAGVILMKNVSLDFTASLGLNNISSAKNYTVRKNAFSLTLGYSF